jgi:hypothetical protein
VFESIQGTTFDAVILHGKLKDELREDAHRFFAAQATYEEYGNPDGASVQVPFRPTRSWNTGVLPSNSPALFSNVPWGWGQYWGQQVACLERVQRPYVAFTCPARCWFKGLSRASRGSVACLTDQRSHARQLPVVLGHMRADSGSQQLM